MHPIPSHPIPSCQPTNQPTDLAIQTTPKYREVKNAMSTSPADRALILCNVTARILRKMGRVACPGVFRPLCAYNNSIPRLFLARDGKQVSLYRALDTLQFQGFNNWLLYTGRVKHRQRFVVGWPSAWTQRHNRGPACRHDLSNLD